MREIQFGIGFRRLDDIAGEAREAEALGYQFVTTGERVFFHGPTGNGLISLAATAGSPDDCIGRLKEYIAAGARTIILNSACPGTTWWKINGCSQQPC